MNAIWSGAIHAQGMLLSDIRWKDLLDALRGIIEAKHFKKHPFQTDAVASSWLNQSRDDRKSKTRPRNKHQIIRQKLIMQNGRSKRSLHESQGEPRGERDVIRLRNPTEDKRTFRRMLTSADRPRLGPRSSGLRNQRPAFRWVRLPTFSTPSHFYFAVFPVYRYLLTLVRTDTRPVR